MYGKIKLDLKIDDLLRYGINAVIVDEYEEITLILEEIEKRILRRNIFISGAAAEYTPFSETTAKDLIHKLSFSLAEKSYKIVSGYGLGIGSIVINGALDYKLNSNYRNLDDLLILRPFPQIQSGEKSIKDVWTDYRQDMISKSGIAVFMFGNKIKDNEIVDSDGMLEEFDICLKNNVIPIPIGATGSISEKLWDQVHSSIEDLYPDNKTLHASILKLGDSSLDNEEIIKNIIIAINILQKI